VSDANVVKLVQPASFADPLTEELRNGARTLLAQEIEAEVADFLAKHVDLKTATGLRRVVRHGHLPEREVMTGIGPVGVRQPRVRDCGAADDAGRIRFTLAILPPERPFRRAVPSRRIETGARVGCFPVPRGLPRNSGGSASATSLSRPPQASLMLRPVGSGQKTILDV
jgi:hypothetical protein